MTEDGLTSIASAALLLLLLRQIDGQCCIYSMYVCSSTQRATQWSKPEPISIVKRGDAICEK